MRDSIENISQLQKKLNDLQLENQILKNILDKAGLSYHKELSKLRQSGSKEAFDPEQGKRIIHPQAITENMANQFFSMFWGFGCWMMRSDGWVWRVSVPVVCLFRW